MREVAVLLALAVGTYLMRAAFFALPIDPPRALARGLPYVGPAVLAAIVVPGVLARPPGAPVLAVAPSLLAVAATVLLWRRTASFPASLLGGMAIWWLLQLLAGLDVLP